MIAGIFHEGSGLGNQLFRYVAVRTIAEKKGYDFTMLFPDNFKGSGFIQLPSLMDKWEQLHEERTFHEKKVIDQNGVDIRGYDPEINFIEDNTIVDGEFQDERYFDVKKLGKFLITEPLKVPDDTCLIGFRGGEYSAFSDLFLPKSYYFKGVQIMKEKFGITKFEVHTDDPQKAREFFPDFPIVDNTQLSHSRHSNMGFNWRSMRNAKYAIIANSSFYILPRLMAHNERPSITIAPRYWARYNTKTWGLPQNYYKAFSYIHHES